MSGKNNPARRSFLNLNASAEDGDAATSTPGAAAPVAPPSSLSTIPVASRTKKPRTRTWEKRNRGYTFKGVPKELQEQVLAIAQEMRDTQGVQGGADAVARVFIDFALTEYQAGKLEIPFRAGVVRTTLAWEAAWGEARKMPGRRKKTEKKGPPPQVTYRLSGQQFEALRGIISREEQKHAPTVIHLPLGQVITCFLAYALQAFQDGKFRLTTIPAATISVEMKGVW